MERRDDVMVPVPRALAQEILAALKDLAPKPLGAPGADTGPIDARDVLALDVDGQLVVLTPSNGLLRSGYLGLVWRNREWLDRYCGEGGYEPGDAQVITTASGGAAFTVLNDLAARLGKALEE